MIEEDLDVEYRVLMSDFMRKALGCAEFIYRQSPAERGTPPSRADSSTRVRSTELRRRRPQSERSKPPSADPAAAHGE